MRIPPNYGPEYTSQFAAVYGGLARADKVPLVPFFMERIALQPNLMQADNIHPNADGQPILLDNLWPVLQPMLRK
jgi:acyl-CoA thioesterase-1